MPLLPFMFSLLLHRIPTPEGQGAASERDCESIYTISGTASSSETSHTPYLSSDLPPRYEEKETAASTSLSPSSEPSPPWAMDSSSIFYRINRYLICFSNKKYNRIGYVLTSWCSININNKPSRLSCQCLRPQESQSASGWESQMLLSLMPPTLGGGGILRVAGWKSRGSERLINLFKVTLLLNGEVGLWTHLASFWKPGAYLYPVLSKANQKYWLMFSLAHWVSNVHCFWGRETRLLSSFLYYFLLLFFPFFSLSSFFLFSLFLFSFFFHSERR